MVGKTCNLPTSCPRGSKFDIQRIMSCKKGSFIYIQHIDLRDLAEMCKDTETRPISTLLSGEELQGTASNNSNEARLGLEVSGNEVNMHFLT